MQLQLVLLTILGLNDHQCMYLRFLLLPEALNGFWSRYSSLTLTSCDSLLCFLSSINSDDAAATKVFDLRGLHGQFFPSVLQKLAQCTDAGRPTSPPQSPESGASESHDVEAQEGIM